MKIKSLKVLFMIIFVFSVFMAMTLTVSAEYKCENEEAQAYAQEYAKAKGYTVEFGIPTIDITELERNLSTMSKLNETITRYKFIMYDGVSAIGQLDVSYSGEKGFAVSNVTIDGNKLPMALDDISYEDIVILEDYIDVYFLFSNEGKELAYPCFIFSQRGIKYEMYDLKEFIDAAMYREVYEPLRPYMFGDSSRGITNYIGKTPAENDTIMMVCIVLSAILAWGGVLVIVKLTRGKFKNRK